MVTIALPAFSGRTRTFSLLYPANRHMPLRVRVLVDFLLEQITGPDSLRA